MLEDFLVPLSGPSRDNRYSVRSGVRSQLGKYCRSPYGSDGIKREANQNLKNGNFLKLLKNSGFFCLPTSKKSF